MACVSDNHDDDLFGYEYFHPADVLCYHVGDLVRRCQKRRFWDPPPGGKELSTEEDQAMYGPIDTTEDWDPWRERWQSSVDQCEKALEAVVDVNRWLRYGLGERAGRLETELRALLPEFWTVLQQVKDPEHFKRHHKEFMKTLGRLAALSEELETVALNPDDGALQEWFKMIEMMRSYLSELLTFHGLLQKTVFGAPRGRIGDALYRYMVAASNFETVLGAVRPQIRRGTDNEWERLIQIPRMCAQARWSFNESLTNNKLPDGSYPTDIHDKLRSEVSYVLHELDVTLAKRPRADQSVALWSLWLTGDTPGNRPTWDKKLRELRFDGALCKRFKTRAPNQELLLDSFQELHWSPRIDNPLKDGKLSETIRQLNRTTKLIRFRADGSGEGVLWELSNPPR